MKIKIIDLFNKIANGEEVPFLIKYEDIILKYDLEGQDYRIYKNGYFFTKLFERPDCKFLNEEVEIIEEERKPITKEDIEAIGYACGEIKKSFENGWKKSLENKPLIEDNKKITPILELHKVSKQLLRSDNAMFINDNFEKINKKLTEVINKINEIIDYTEPKYTGSTYTIKCDESDE